jgi:anti-sigma28 factor (negative regulator of flagellin synthesis)
LKNAPPLFVGNEVLNFSLVLKTDPSCEKDKNSLTSPPGLPIQAKEVVMKKNVSQITLTSNTLSATGLALSTFSIHPAPWAATIRPTDACDLRFNKIAHLRATIAAGIYRVSSATLAEKLIDHMRNNV